MSVVSLKVFRVCVCLKVVRVCWENQLYDAMIYVFNSGMNDYITPMEVSLPLTGCFLTFIMSELMHNL